MSYPTEIHMTLRSDTCFASGVSTPGEVDIEILHDDSGLPFANGTAVQSIVKDMWLRMRGAFPGYQGKVEESVFGVEGSVTGAGKFGLGDFQVDAETRAWVAWALNQNAHVDANDILRSLTSIRYQTAEDRATGAPAKTTLRSMRTIRRGLTLAAPIVWTEPPDDDEVACIELAVGAVFEAGLRRNRGLGCVTLELKT